MRVRVKGLLVFVSLICLVSVSAALAQQRRSRTGEPQATAPRQQADLKITYRTTTSGQSSESTTMIKGKRERSEMRMGYGMDIISITQCDLKRTVQISEKNRKYVITPMESGATSTASSNSSTMTTTSEPVRRGGVVTYVTTLTDTGERKEMFGFTARHIKSTITIDSSADACTPMKQKMETDGWYIDLTFGVDCDLDRAQMASRPVGPIGGCRDRVVTRQIGAGRKGYPLSETTTMYGPDGSAMFSSTKEVVDLSRAPLDAALFDIPAGYTETTNSQELYGAPSMASMMPSATQDEPSSATSSTSSSGAMSKAAGTLRVGVVPINNRTDRAVALDSLRQRLIGGIESDGIDAIPLVGISPGEIEAEAKAKQCDYVLYTYVSTLKISAAKKLGGMLGRAAGVSGIEKTESRVDFELFAVGETSPRLQSNASAKEEGDEASARASIDTEAKKVSAEVRKRSRG